MIFRLAWRNLWRNRRRTALTLTAMTVAATLCIISLAVYEAMFRDMIDNSTGRFIGDVRIMTVEYERHGKMIDGFDQNLRDSVLSRPDIVGVAGRVRGHLLLQYGEFDDTLAQPAEVIGVEPDEEAGVSTFQNDIVQGRFIGMNSGLEKEECCNQEVDDVHEPLDSSSMSGFDGGIVLGVTLARRMRASIGDEIAAVGQAADGAIAAELFRVIGLIDVGDPARNNTVAFVSRPDLQYALGLEGKVHELVVKLNSPMDAVAWNISLPDGMTSLSWLEALPMIAQVLDLWGAIQFFMTAIIFSAVILVTTNTLLMAFMERRMEYAVVRAMGMAPSIVGRTVVAEAFLLSLTAAVLSVVFGAAGITALSRYSLDFSGIYGSFGYGGAMIEPVLSAQFTPMNTFMPPGMLVLFATMLGLYPAWKAMRIDMAGTLRARE